MKNSVDNKSYDNIKIPIILNEINKLKDILSEKKKINNKIIIECNNLNKNIQNSLENKPKIFDSYFTNKININILKCQIEVQRKYLNNIINSTNKSENNNLGIENENNLMSFNKNINIKDSLKKIQENFITSNNNLNTYITTHKEMELKNFEIIPEKTIKNIILNILE